MPSASVPSAQIAALASVTFACRATYGRSAPTSTFATSTFSSVASGCGRSQPRACAVPPPSFARTCTCARLPRSVPALRTVAFRLSTASLTGGCTISSVTVARALMTCACRTVAFHAAPRSAARPAVAGEAASTSSACQSRRPSALRVACARAPETVALSSSTLRCCRSAPMPLTSTVVALNCAVLPRGPRMRSAPTATRPSARVSASASPPSATETRPPALTVPSTDAVVSGRR